MNCELLYGMSKGASFFINENLENLITDIQKENPTIICSVPRLLYTIHNKLLDNNSSVLTKLLLSDYLIKYSKSLLKKKIFGKNLRMINTGGSAISEDRLKIYQQLGIDVYQGYGLSETSPIISLNHSKLNKLGSVGKILDCNEVIIEENEILVKGTNVFQSYYKNEKETQKVFKNEYFMTGDTGYIDKDNYLYITGRKKELYKLDNGKYINPSYIEMVLLDSTKIKQIFVYGDNKAFNIALIVPNDVNNTNNSNNFNKTILEEIELYSANKLKKYEIPKKILIVESFSVENKLLTHKMSMIRKNIYELYKNEIEQLYIGK
jgi:long-chain acyl-CoA synthetase